MRPHGSLQGRHQASEGRWDALRGLSFRPLCSCDSRQVGLLYLPAGLRYTTGVFALRRKYFFPFFGQVALLCVGVSGHYGSYYIAQHSVPHVTLS